MAMKRERERTKKNGTDQMTYLVGGLEHFFIFRSVGNNHPNWFSYFSEGLKPPTTYYNPIFMLNIHQVNTEHGPLNATYYVGCTPKWLGPRGLGKKHVGFTPEILGYSVRLRNDKQIYDCRLSNCFLCKGGVFQQKNEFESDLDMFGFFVSLQQGVFQVGLASKCAHAPDQSNDFATSNL